MHPPLRAAVGLLMLGMAIIGCSRPPAEPEPALPMHWQPVDSLNALLPDGIRLYAGVNDSLPLRAWYVRIDEADPAIETHVVLSDDTDGKESVTDFASDDGVCVAVNGGYFDMSAMPARHVGLVVSGGRTVAQSTPSTVRDSVRYPLARAAIGFLEGGGLDVGWAMSRRDSVLALDVPVPNHPGAPAAPPDDGAPWPVRDAIAAGPALIVDGTTRITVDEEVFFGTSIPETNPRTAAGYTADGDLLLLVADGRQDASRGVTLEELATLMSELGAVEALNLDGGGSSTLVVQGVLVNRPTGGTFEREVMSALQTRCDGAGPGD